MLAENQEECQHFQLFKCTKSIFLSQNIECRTCGVGKDNLWLCLTVKNNRQREIVMNSTVGETISNIQRNISNNQKRRKHFIVYLLTSSPQKYIASAASYLCLMKSSLKHLSSTIKVQPKSPMPLKYGQKYCLSLPNQEHLELKGKQKTLKPIERLTAAVLAFSAINIIFPIHSAVQFIAHCSYFQDIIQSMKPLEGNTLLSELQSVISSIFDAKYRAILIKKFDQLIYTQRPNLLTYQRKDPFDIVLLILQKLHQQLSYSVVQDEIFNYDKDEWDLFYKKDQIKLRCPIYDSIQIKLKLNYTCSKCKIQDHRIKTINYLKLSIPKRKRPAKEVEKDLIEHRGESPFKNRKKSLLNFFFKEEQIHVTIHELILDLMRKPLHKDKLCIHCKEPMKKNKIQFESLPNYLIIQIARMQSQGYSINDTKVDFSTQQLDFGAFTVNKEKEYLYTFETAICIEKGCFYPVLARNAHNKQLQVFRNENITYSQKLNPYIICYKRNQQCTSIQKYNTCLQIINNNEKKEYLLPNFWMLQMKHSFQRQLCNSFACKHNNLKPGVESKEIHNVFVTKQLYEDLSSFYYGKVYNTKPCNICLGEADRINERKKRQRQQIKIYDSIKTQIFCMIGIEWITKWSNFIYKRGNLNYMVKGYPFPGRIDNKSILSGKKCKPYLVQDRDFKIINIYVWRFLKELYGGGTEIRYKWKKDGNHQLDESLLQSLKLQADKIRSIYAETEVEFSQKKSTTMQQSSYKLDQQMQPSVQDLER